MPTAIVVPLTDRKACRRSRSCQTRPHSRVASQGPPAAKALRPSLSSQRLANYRRTRRIDPTPDQPFCSCRQGRADHDAKIKGPIRGRGRRRAVCMDKRKVSPAFNPCSGIVSEKTARPSRAALFGNGGRASIPSRYFLAR